MGTFLASAGNLAGSTILQVTALHDDNANLAISEQKSDRALDGLLEFSNLRPVSPRWSAGFAARLQSTAWQEYPGLNLTEIGVDLAASRKFGLGPYVPKLDVRIGVSHQFSKVSDWSGTWLRASGTWQRRFNPAWQASVTGNFDQLDAGRQVYSTTNVSGTLRIDYDPTSDWRVTMAVSRRSGEQLSWCRASWPKFVGTNQWLDGIFGGDWFPYKEKARAMIGEVSVTRALGPDTGLALACEYHHSDITPDHTYIRRILSLRLIHSF